MKLIYSVYRYLAVRIFTAIVMLRVGSAADRPFVGGYTKLNRNTHLGKNNNFNGMKILGSGSVTIGDNFHSGIECMMITEVHDYHGQQLPYDTTRIPKPIVIEDNVWFGNRVLILGGVAIGEGAIVQAGAVVVTNIPRLSIVGGNPAKPFRMRDAVHYEDLKRRGAFH